MLGAPAVEERPEPLEAVSEPPPVASTAPDTETRHPELHRSFQGLWGARVLWLPALGLLPLLLGAFSETLGLGPSAASLAYAGYLWIGGYLWISVRGLEKPGRFVDAEIERLHRLRSK